MLAVRHTGARAAELLMSRRDMGGSSSFEGLKPKFGGFNRESEARPPFLERVFDAGYGLIWTLGQWNINLTRRRAHGPGSKSFMVDDKDSL